MKNITELVRCRRSVRTFDGRKVNEDNLKKLALFMEKIENPYGIPIEFKFLDGKKQALLYPVVSGTDLYVGAKATRMPHMDRPAYGRAFVLGENEVMPCVSPLGYPARKKSVRETMMRKAIKADSRNPFEAIFLTAHLMCP